MQNQVTNVAQKLTFLALVVCKLVLLKNVSIYFLLDVDPFNNVSKHLFKINLNFFSIHVTLWLFKGTYEGVYN